MAKSSKDLPDSTITRMQEIGSAWIFKRAIQDNASKNWKSPEDIQDDDVTFNELEKIWWEVGRVKWNDNVDNEWLESFYKQQVELLDKIGQPKFTEFTRDGSEDGKAYRLPGSKQSGETFMEWVENYLGDEFQIGNKDNWNPADIWLIQDEEKWKNVIKKATKTPKKTKGSIKAQLNQFNQIFRILFRSKQIMGISLKKVSGGKAVYKEINTTQAFFKNLESTSMKLTGVKCFLGTKRINVKLDKNKRSDTFGEWIVDTKKHERSIRKGLGVTGYPTVETQDSWLFIEDSLHGVDYKVQIKNTSTDKMDNLKFEPTEKGKSAARMGKATRAFVFDLMKAYGILNKFPKTHQNYPSSKTTFTRAKMNETEKKIKAISAKCTSLGIPFDMGGATDRLENIKVSSTVAVVNIKEAMGKKNEAWIANSKLQQIGFLDAVLSLPKTGQYTVDDFCTDLIYLAAKMGRKGGFHDTGYGPFGKIY